MTGPEFGRILAAWLEARIEDPDNAPPVDVLRPALTHGAHDLIMLAALALDAWVDVIQRGGPPRHTDALRRQVVVALRAVCDIEEALAHVETEL